MLDDDVVVNIYKYCSDKISEARSELCPRIKQNVSNVVVVRMFLMQCRSVKCKE